MTINNKKLRLVENAHSEKTMDNLSKLLKDNDMSQVELAKKLGEIKQLLIDGLKITEI